MKTEFYAFKDLLEKKAMISDKRELHLFLIDTYYHDRIVQVENLGKALKGKTHLRELELKNLEKVSQLDITINHEVFDEENSIVCGEMSISLVFKDLKKIKIEEAFMQIWEGGKIIYQRFFYNPYDMS